MGKKKPLYGVSVYKKDKPRKRPGRHKKNPNKHEKRMGKFRRKQLTIILQRPIYRNKERKYEI